MSSDWAPSADVNMLQLRAIREQLGQLADGYILAYLPFDWNTQVEVFASVLLFTRIEGSAWQILDTC